MSTDGQRTMRVADDSKPNPRTGFGQRGTHPRRCPKKDAALRCPIAKCRRALARHPGGGATTCDTPSPPAAEDPHPRPIEPPRLILMETTRLRSIVAANVVWVHGVKLLHTCPVALYVGLRQRWRLRPRRRFDKGARVRTRWARRAVAPSSSDSSSLIEVVVSNAVASRHMAQPVAYAIRRARSATESSSSCRPASTDDIRHRPSAPPAATRQLWVAEEQDELATLTTAPACERVRTCCDRREGRGRNRRERSLTPTRERRRLEHRRLVRRSLGPTRLGLCLASSPLRPRLGRARQALLVLCSAMVSGHAGLAASRSGVVGRALDGICPDCPSLGSS